MTCFVPVVEHVWSKYLYLGELASPAKENFGKPKMFTIVFLPMEVETILPSVWYARVQLFILTIHPVLLLGNNCSYSNCCNIFFPL